MGKTTRLLRYDVNKIKYDYTVDVRNRFKGLDLIECLKNYGRNFLTLYRRQESRLSPRKKLQNGGLGRPYKYCEKKRSEKQRRKGKIQASDVEFQRRAKRDKKAFLDNQCKEIEENNRMGKTRDLLKKIRDAKGTFDAKMGSIKDRSGINLTKAEDIKKRWQEYTEELYKKDLHDPDNHNGVITHLEPDILECEVKWALGSITMNKASGGDGIPVELFQILKDDAVKLLHSISQQIWKTQQWPQDWKRSVFIPIPKKANAKECSNYHTIILISHASKIMLKILQARLQQYVNHEFLMFKLLLEKAEEPEIKLPTSAGSWKNQESSKKTSISALLTMPKPLSVWITINCGKFFKRWKYQTT